MRKTTAMIAFAMASFLVSCKKNNNTLPSQSISIEKTANKESAWKHLEAIQKIADKNQNHRSVGSPGGIATADYIIEQLQLLGLKPEKIPFETQDAKKNIIKGQNIIVEIPGKSSDVIMFGAHYDSVEMGPGINDNATGVAILLEMALAAKKTNIQPEKTIRIAFWDAEELGVLGSPAYIKNLSEPEKKKISSYINIDMVGTKDPEIIILDGDGSSIPPLKEDFKKAGISDKEIENILGGMPKAHPGSAELEKIVEEYLKSKKILYKDDLMTSLSTDTIPFFQLSPTTGIVMTHPTTEANDVLLFAPCYHQACDNISNVDKKSFNIALGLVAHMVDKLALK